MDDIKQHNDMSDFKVLSNSHDVSTKFLDDTYGRTGDANPKVNKQNNDMPEYKAFLNSDISAKSLDVTFGRTKNNADVNHKVAAVQPLPGLEIVGLEKKKKS